MTASFDYLPALLSALQADSTLTGTLTGGIYLKREMREEITNRKVYPAAYNNGKEMKPLLIIKGRRVIPNGAKDASNQYQATRQPVEFWFHQDGDAGFATLRTAANRLYALIQMKPYAGAAQWRMDGELEDNDPALNNAATIMKEYLLIGSRKV